MAIVVKTIRGREYRYSQTSQRVAGKVVTKSVYLGPVIPKRKRGGGAFGIVGLTVPNLLVGAVLVGVKTLKGDMGPPGGRAFPPPKQSFRVAHDPRRVIGEDEWSARRAEMTDGEWELYIGHAQHALKTNPENRQAAMKTARSTHSQAIDTLHKEHAEAAKAAREAEAVEAPAADEGES